MNRGCLHHDCTEDALDGFEYCAKHQELHERRRESLRRMTKIGQEAGEYSSEAGQ